MKDFYTETVKNCEEYLRGANFAYAAKMFKEEEGFLCQKDEKDRTYYIVYRIDKRCKSIIIEVSPYVHCDDAYRAQAGEYILMVNSLHKYGNLRIDSSGHVYSMVEASFANGALSRLDFDEMTTHCIGMLKKFGGPIEKLSHGRLLCEKDMISAIMLENIFEDTLPNVQRTPTRNFTNKGLGFPLSLDEMMADIDRKIAELDAELEEAEEKSDNDGPEEDTDGEVYNDEIDDISDIFE